MFTGIIENIGTITKLQPKACDTQLWVKAPFDLAEVALGDSIAINGCCLTVTAKQGDEFSADLSQETLQKTALSQLQIGDSVNLERALKLGDRLGGHLVQGHVDGVGEIIESKLIQSDPKTYHLLKVRVPISLKHYMIAKGSVAIDGISLTINEVAGEVISLFVIPHTLSHTTLTAKQVGDRLNIEADCLVKMVERLLEPVLKNK